MWWAGTKTTGLWGRFPLKIEDMKNNLLFTTVALLALSCFGFEQDSFAQRGTPQRKIRSSDRLIKTQFDIKAAEPEAVLNKTIENLKGVFLRYKPALDSNTEIVSPLKVGGTATRPNFSIGLRKCVFVVCETVDLEAAMSLREVSGSCERNLVLDADLRRSSARMSDNFQALKVDICFQSKGTNARITTDAWAIRAPSYSDGLVTDEILKMLKMQIQPMSDALKKSLVANGASVIR